MNGRIGKYNGIDCYKITREEYIKERFYKNKEVIFIIDKDMVYQNVVIGTYDGKYVNDYDRHKQYTYYVEPKEPIGIATTYRADGTADYDVSWNSNSETEMEVVDKILKGVYDKEDYVSKLLLEASA